MAKQKHVVTVNLAIDPASDKAISKKEIRSCVKTALDSYFSEYDILDKNGRHVVSKLSVSLPQIK